VLTLGTTSRIRRLFPRQPLSRARADARVAAVCFRIREGEVQFLLVQSRAGRWTFPKGRVDDDPSRAAAAAREALEEAGAYGCVDDLPFVSYRHAKNPRTETFPDEHVVDAHLCEVMELVPPEETYRNPTWFSPAKSKLRLHEKRSTTYGSELAQVIDRALAHISRRRTFRSRFRVR
jgi:8-oxo-dGTP pyrophosphatase MutT (NUDIX family)